ncbi:MAG: OmpA family protein, partial [Saprospiraceae bacterium]|nr:OmpA family protein [Saprospiraceae bacterium]
MANENINQVVSENKALACKQYIVSQGIEAARIHLTGFGSSKPLTKAEKRKGRKDNNRVEFRLMLEVN